MSQRLPVFINPEHACARRLMANGVLMLENMQRLRDRLLEPYGEVSVDLSFSQEGRNKRLDGTIKGKMVVECQRCMEPMQIDVDHQFKLAFISSDAEVDSLLPDEEPCLIGGEDLVLSDIIEDELELLLPMIVMHENEQCNKEKYTNSEDARDTEDEKDNPFSILADLKD